MKTITWYDGRTHDDIVGDNDEAFCHELMTQMLPPTEPAGHGCMGTTDPETGAAIAWDPYVWA